MERQQLQEYIRKYPDKTNTQLAELIVQEGKYDVLKKDSLRRNISKARKAMGEGPSDPTDVTPTQTTTETNQYKNKAAPYMSPFHPEKGHWMEIREFCEYYNQPYDQVASYKLVNIPGPASYNIAFKIDGQEEDDEESKEAVYAELRTLLDRYQQRVTFMPTGERAGVLIITDLHFGAYISEMQITPDFNITILLDMLREAVATVNRFDYDVVHVHILGDLIESFTGLNHKNSWKGLQKGMYGVSAVKLLVELLHTQFLGQIKNLGRVKIVGGNHDRVTSDNTEDVDAGVADLVAWSLNLLGYKVEFSSSVLKHVVGSICHILLHGHHGISKLSTEEICWKYGEKGLYCLVQEGHLHSRIQRLSATGIKNFKTILHDGVDSRRFICPSLFTGNTFSEHLGYSTNAGYLITEESSSKKINIHDYSC